MATGVFSLKQVYKRQYQNVKNNDFASWPESSIVGYFGGGYTPTITSSLLRMDLSTETITSIPTKLSNTLSFSGTVTSTSYGYFSAGRIPTGRVSNVNRLEFSTETRTNPSKVYTQSNGIDTQAGVNSNYSYGYFFSGFSPNFSPDVGSAVYRLDFSSENLTLTSATVSNTGRTRAGQAVQSYHTNYGYFAGGGDPSPNAYSSVIDRFSFSTETLGQIPNFLSGAKWYFASVESAAYGYFAGGFPTVVSTIDRLDFSTDTVSTPTPKLSTIKSELKGFSNSSYGYFGGGLTPVSVSTIDRLNFSTETVNVTGTKLPTTLNGHMQLSGGQSVGN